MTVGVLTKGPLHKYLWVTDERGVDLELAEITINISD